MHLIDFMNKYADWKDRLAEKPYCLDIKSDGDYYILKYNIIESDFTKFEVLEARGSIFRKDENGIWICVCRALDKFGNYGESYAATPYIKWNMDVDVQEKIDGSIIKVWYDCGKWWVSTNGTIDAFKAECGDTTFGDLFVKVLGIEPDLFSLYLNPECCYFFELVCPLYNHIVVQYKENGIYYLGCRNLKSGMEIMPDESFMRFPTIKYPRHFHYTSLAQCIEAARRMGVDEEGYVVTAYKQMENGSFLRVKVKGDEYLRLHKMRGNGPLTTVQIVEMWQNDSLDDFLAYYPEYKEMVEKVIARLRNLIEISDIGFKVVWGYVNENVNNRRTFARYASTYIQPVRAYLFARLDNKIANATEFYKGMRARNLAEHLKLEDI